MTPTEITDHLSEVNPEALLLEPRSVFDDALIDYQEREGVVVAVYDISRMTEAVMAWLDASYDKATDYIGFNVLGSGSYGCLPEYRYEEE